MRKFLISTFFLGSAWAAADPQISLSLNGTTNGKLYRGWPAIASVTIVHPELGASRPELGLLEIIADSGSWMTTVKLVVQKAGSGEVVWPMTLLDWGGGSSLPLDRETYGRIVWTLSPEQTALLEPGVYILTAVLDTTGSMTGWHGNAASVPVTLTVTDEPEQISAERDRAKARALARYDLLTDHIDAGLAVLAPLLETNPDDFFSLELKGDLLMGQQRVVEAWIAYRDGMVAFQKLYPSPREPNLSLSGKQQAAWRRSIGE